MGVHRSFLGPHLAVGRGVEVGAHGVRDHGDVVNVRTQF